MLHKHHIHKDRYYGRLRRYRLVLLPLRRTIIATIPSIISIIIVVIAVLPYSLISYSRRRNISGVVGAISSSAASTNAAKHPPSLPAICFPSWPPSGVPPLRCELLALVSFAPHRFYSMGVNGAAAWRSRSLRVGWLLLRWFAWCRRRRRRRRWCSFSCCSVYGRRLLLLRLCE